MKKIIVAKFKVKESKINLFESLAKPLIEETNKEEGCLEYQLYKNNTENNEYLFFEQYKNQEAINRHSSSQHFKSFITGIDGLLSEEIDIKILNE